MKKILSVILTLAMAMTLSIPISASDISEKAMDAELRDRGYPQTYLDCISLSSKESLYGKKDVTFAGATVICYDEDTGIFTDYNIPSDGIMPAGQIPVSDLTLVFGISRYSTSGNVLVNYSYDWNDIPICRFQDTLSVSWDEDVFRMIDNSFHRYDMYVAHGQTIVFTEDSGYAQGSPCGVSWYAHLNDNSVDKLYGYGEFLLEPLAPSGTRTVLYGHYVHPTVEVSMSVNIASFGSFSVSSGGQPYDERGNQRTYTI